MNDRQSQPESEPLVHVVLVAPQIPWNTGNVGRSCLAAGAQLHLIRPLGYSLEDRYLKRAGLDYWPHVKPRVWPSWRAFEPELPTLGEPYFFSAEAERDLWSVHFPRRVVLIFGSETAGLPPDLRGRYPTRLLAIPMRRDPVRSLNLSTAAAITLFEVSRQSGKKLRKFKKR